jgi:hypothetical protein
VDIKQKRHSRNRTGLVLTGLGSWLCISLFVLRLEPGWAMWIGLADGLAVGTVLGATGLIPDYDYAWDEFWQATALTYMLGIFALLVYWARRETPSAFFWVELAAGSVGYSMLLFVSPLQWLAADSLLFAGTFVGWLMSGFFKPGYV